MVLLFSGVGPSSAQKLDSTPKAVDAKGTSSAPGWSFDYPDFAVALQEEKWSFILKAVAPNVIGAGDSAEILLTDSAGKEILNDFGFSSGANGTIEFSNYLSSDDFNKVDLTRPFSASIKVNRGFGSTFKNSVITILVPVTSFPQRPVSSKEYVTIQTVFSPIPFPQSCTPTEFQFVVNDPYGDISSVTFSVVDSLGKEIASAYSFGPESGLIKKDVQICPFSLNGTSAPYVLQTKISFGSSTGKLALSDSTPFPIASKADEAVARAATLGDFCAKGKESKVVPLGRACPTGYKKINFTVPSEVAWNSLTRVPNSQKNKNYVIYACVAQFDANTGGSKFRGYASQTQPRSYFGEGVNSIFTGSAKQLLKLSEKTAFIAKVTVTGGVTYSTTLGGRTSVPSLAIRQFQSIGSC